jgi:hypothetical protein
VVLILALPFLRVFIVEKGVGMPFYSTLAVPTSLFATLLILRKRLTVGESKSAAEKLDVLPREAASE